MLIGGRAHSLEEANFVGEAQFDFAEINLLDPHHASQEITSLLELKKKFNFFFLIHGPEEGNPFDCKELQAIWLPQIKALFDFADKLNTVWSLSSFGENARISFRNNKRKKHTTRYFDIDLINRQNSLF